MRLELRISRSATLWGAIPRSGVLSCPPERCEGLLTGSRVRLRRLETDDIDFLYRWENDPEVWGYGDCGADKTSAGKRVMGERFTRDKLYQFIDNQLLGFWINHQLRMVICADADAFPTTPIGFIDLFDFDPAEQSAGVGILICDPANRCHGYGSEALRLTIEYARYFLGLRTLWCDVSTDNPASLALFSSAGFVHKTDAMVYA